MDEGTDEGENGALLSLTSMSKRGLGIVHALFFYRSRDGLGRTLFGLKVRLTLILKASYLPLT